MISSESAPVGRVRLRDSLYPAKIAVSITIRNKLLAIDAELSAEFINCLGSILIFIYNKNRNRIFKIVSFLHHCGRTTDRQTDVGINQIYIVFTDTNTDTDLVTDSDTDTDTE